MDAGLYEELRHVVGTESATGRDRREVDVVRDVRQRAQERHQLLRAAEQEFPDGPDLLPENRTT